MPFRTIDKKTEWNAFDDYQVARGIKKDLRQCKTCKFSRNGEPYTKPGSICSVDCRKFSEWRSKK